MASEGYIREKLFAAVGALATGTGTIRERLLSAYLSMHTLEPDDFPDDDGRRRFEEIVDKLTTFEQVRDEGSVAASTALMTEDQAVEVASAIVDLDGHYRPL